MCGRFGGGEFAGECPEAIILAENAMLMEVVEERKWL